MEHGKQVEILKALIQQLDEGKNIDAGVQYRHQTKAYVCTDRAAKEEKEFFKTTLNSLVYLEIYQKKAVIWRSMTLGYPFSRRGTRMANLERS